MALENSFAQDLSNRYRELKNIRVRPSQESVGVMSRTKGKRSS